ncbi:hypothetical protein BGZ65_000344, partial [Modicella reniformis]
MERVLNKKAAARAMAAPAPTKKKQKKPASNIIRPKRTSTFSTESIQLQQGSLPKKRKPLALEQEEDNKELDEPPVHDLDFLSLLSPSLSKKVKRDNHTFSNSLSSSSSSSLSTSLSTIKSSTKSVSKPRSGPEVVIFDSSKVDRKASTGGIEFNFKKFMSSKISKLDE